MKVVLITGSREHTDAELIRRELQQADPDLVVHGACGWDADYPEAHKLTRLRGADGIAAEWACEPPQPTATIAMPARWSKRGRYAGPQRNAVMIDLVFAMAECGHDVKVIAFPLGASPGTRGCADLARKRGLAVDVVCDERADLRGAR